MYCLRYWARYMRKGEVKSGGIKIGYVTPVHTKKKIERCERPRPRPVFYRMLGQTHVNGWSRVVVSQNGGSISYIKGFTMESPLI